MRVTLFISTDTPIFRKMNPLNKFLVLLLAELGYAHIENLYTKYGPKSEIPLAQACQVESVPGKGKSRALRAYGKRTPLWEFAIGRTSSTAAGR